jgi:hypothetical protein
MSYIVILMSFTAISPSIGYGRMYMHIKYVTFEYAKSCSKRLIPFKLQKNIYCLECTFLYFALHRRGQSKYAHSHRVIVQKLFNDSSTVAI